MNRRLSEIQVGVLTVAAILILTVGMLWFKNVKLSGSYTYYQVDFGRVEGLRVGDKVQVRGIRMGEVSGLKMLDTSVRVEMKIEDAVALTDEAEVILGEKGIVGQIVLEIDPGTGQPVAEGHIFQGRTAGTIAAMTDAAGEALNEIHKLTIKVSELVDEVRESGKVVETLNQANATLVKIDAMVEANRADFEGSLHNLAAASEGLRRIVESHKIEDTLDGATSTLTQADSLMTTLTDAAGRLDTILTKMEDGDGSVAKLLNDPALYDRADSTLTSVSRLVDAMRRNPKRYFKVNVLDF